MFIDVKEAAKALSVSERFLRQLISEGRIPVYRLSPRTTRLDLDELRSYMRLQTQTSIDGEGEGQRHG